MKTSTNVLLETTENSNWKQANFLMDVKTSACEDSSLIWCAFEASCGLSENVEAAMVWDAA